jgi:hypothetical protein
MLTRILILLLLALIVTVVVQSLPDIRRYLRMRGM